MSATSRLSPIAIMSFNRPDYLREVLASLRAQVDGGLDDRDIVLFQDGGQNAASGAARAADQDIDDSVRVFETIFPGRPIERSPVNLGVARNFDRAETHVFEALDADAAIFLEDDLVLAPRYLQVMDTLIAMARDDERIGYVAAYGPHWLPLSEQRKRPAHYVLLEHNWAFGLLRRQWLRNKPFVEQYLAILGDCDYKLRPHTEIHRLYHSWGMGCPGTSQDVTKTLACCLTGAIKINTTMCLGRYIGAHGLHMNPAAFAKGKYPQTEVFTDPPPALETLTDADYHRIFAPQRRWALDKPCRLDQVG